MLLFFATWIEIKQPTNQPWVMWIHSLTPHSPKRCGFLLSNCFYELHINCYQLGLTNTVLSQNHSEDTWIIKGVFFSVNDKRSDTEETHVHWRSQKFVHNKMWPKLTGKSQAFSDCEVNYFPESISLLMVNGCFGALWFGFLSWDWHVGAPLESQTTNPNHQLNIPYLLALLKMLFFLPFGGMCEIVPWRVKTMVFSPLARWVVKQCGPTFPGGFPGKPRIFN